MSVAEAVAASGAGVAESTALKWETRVPAVGQRIHELSAIATKNAIINTGLDRQWVISRLMTITERCMQSAPVLDASGAQVLVVTPDGEIKPAYAFDAKGANKALELLGKTLGLFDGKKQDKEDDLGALSDDELAAIAQELAAQIGFNPGAARVIEAQESQSPRDV